MPGRDGTGPLGQGPVGGGAGTGREGRGARGNVATGSGGYCVCLQCGEKVPHQRATPCSLVTCPKCGSTMVRGQS
jgi:hypothetical protein